MGNWLTRQSNKAVQAIQGIKHLVLTNNNYHNIANGNLTIMGMDSITGQVTDDKLISEGFEKNPQAYSVISMIAETGSDIPWIANEILPNGRLKPLTTGRFYNAVTMPNSKQTQQEFKLSSYIYYLTTGDLFWSREIIIGIPTKELNVLPSQLMQIVVDRADPFTPVGYKFEIGGARKAFTTDEIIHQKFVNPSTKGVESNRGLAPLAPAWLTISADNQRIQAQESSMRNRGAAGILTNESDVVMSDIERDEQQTRLDRMFGGATSFAKILIGKMKARFLQIGLSPSDLQLLETGVQHLRTFSNVFHAPSELFNDPENKTHANRKVATKSFYENSILPIDRRMLSRYNRDIVSEWSKADKKKYVVTQDLTRIGALQEDENIKATRAARFTASISSVIAEMSNGLTPASAAAIIAEAHNIPLEEAEKFVILKNNIIDNG